MVPHADRGRKYRRSACSQTANLNFGYCPSAKKQSTDSEGRSRRRREPGSKWSPLRTRTPLSVRSAASLKWALAHCERRVGRWEYNAPYTNVCVVVMAHPDAKIDVRLSAMQVRRSALGFSARTFASPASAIGPSRRAARLPARAARGSARARRAGRPGSFSQDKPSARGRRAW